MTSTWDGPPNRTPDLSGSMWGRIRSVTNLDNNHSTLVVELPLTCDPQPPTGTVFLVRCGVTTPEERFTNWNYFAPVPLFAMQCRPVPALSGEESLGHSTWQLALDRGRTFLHGAAVDWLLGRSNEDSILISGPFGNRFLAPAPETRRNLLILTQGLQFLPLSGAIHACLDAGGRVTLAELPAAASNLAAHLPLQVEIQQLTSLHDAAFTELVRWADTLLVANSSLSMPDLAFALSRARFQTTTRRSSSPRPLDEFAYVLVDADYLCGYGACLSCTVPTAGGGVTRACMHGPIIPLSGLATV